MSDRKATLAVFDFDGTITRSDSLLPFLRSAVGANCFFLNAGWIAFWVCAYRLRIVSRQFAKERVLARYLRGTSDEQLQEMASRFVEAWIPQAIRPAALSKLVEHLHNRDRVVIVSASPELYLGLWARSLGQIEVLATQLEFDSRRRFTGRILGRNCRGEEKVRRLLSAIPDYQDYHVIVYGDSSGDRNLYQIAAKVHHRCFSPQGTNQVRAEDLLLNL